MLKKYIKYLVILLTMFTVFGMNNIKAEDGSITIDIIYQDEIDGEKINIPIPGIAFDVYRIWTYDTSDKEDYKVVFDDPFNNIHEINSDMSEDEIQKTANDFYEHINEADVLLTTEKSDENGHIRVDNLEIGAYLMFMNEPYAYKGALYEVAPFLITIPMKEKSGWLYDVNAFPKLSIVRDEPPLEKKVNGEYEYKLKANYEVVTYSIHTKMPKLASEFYVFDTLEPVLEFAPHESIDELVTVEIGSYKLNKEELKKQVKIEGQTLTVTFTKEQLEKDKEKDITITFGARIRKGADLSKYESKRVPNDCEYVIDNKFSKKSNIVPITPPPPPWNPPKTGIPFIDSILENPYLLSTFAFLMIVLAILVRRRNRSSYQR